MLKLAIASLFISNIFSLFLIYKFQIELIELKNQIKLLNGTIGDLTSQNLYLQKKVLLLNGADAASAGLSQNFVLETPWLQYSLVVVGVLLFLAVVYYSGGKPPQSFPDSFNPSSDITSTHGLLDTIAQSTESIVPVLQNVNTNIILPNGGEVVCYTCSNGVAIYMTYKNGKLSDPQLQYGDLSAVLDDLMACLVDCEILDNVLRRIAELANAIV